MIESLRKYSALRAVMVAVVWLATSAQNADVQAQGAGGVSGPGERLVPAAMGIRTDKHGNSWNIEQNGTLGRVGSSMVNSGLNLLINGNQFYTYQPLMTADGSEYVLHNRQSSGLSGLLVARRIKVMEAEGVVRYIEVLANTTSNPISLNVTLRTQFSGNYKAYYTNQGNSSAVTLGPRESGVLVTPGSAQANRAVIFSLCSPKASLKPSISSQNRYGLSFQYNVQLAAGQTVCLAHAVAQVPVPQSFDRKALGRLFRSVDMDRIGATIPTDLRALTENYRRPASLGGIEVLSIPGASALGVDRARRDVLALGETTRLLGSASCGGMSLKSGFGSAEIPFEQVTAIEGGNRKRRDGARIFLADGQVFSGNLTAESLRFVMASGGNMDLDVSRLDRLVRAEKKDEGKWAPETSALLESYGGDRLALVDGESVELTGLTPWGALRFKLDEILWLSPQEDEPVGHYIEFRNGTRCFAFLAGDEVSLKSAIFGEFSIPISQIRALLSRGGRERSLAEAERHKAGDSPDEITPLQPYLRLVGKQRLVGEVLDSHLHLLTHAEPIAVAPREIRRMTRLDAEAALAPGRGPQFRVELWGGGVVSGHLGETFVSVDVRGAAWQVPVADIVELVTPVPKLSDGARKDIARLLRQLGADDWQQREAATEELSGFGYLAKSIFEDELRASRDAEVSRRLERILAGLD